MASVMFVVHAKDGDGTSYYTDKARFDHIGGSLLFRLLPKLLDGLKYYGLYRFAHRMGTDPVLPAMSFNWCFEVDRGKTVVRNNFVSYDFCTGKFYGLQQKSVPTTKRVRGV